MGIKLTKEKENFAKKIKESFDFETFTKEIEEFTNNKSNLNYQANFSDEVEEISSLHQQQFQFFIYYSVNKLEELIAGEIGNEIQAKKIQFLVMNLEKVLNYYSICKIRKMENILWKSSDYKVNHC